MFICNFFSGKPEIRQTSCSGLGKNKTRKLVYLMLYMKVHARL